MTGVSREPDQDRTVTSEELHHVVMFSGGVGSWATAKYVVNDHVRPGDRLTLLFADTLMEDPDLYRFLDDAAANVGGDLVNISDGRDVWQVFHDVRYLGNTRIDPCSFHLKRRLMRKWLEYNCDPATTVCYIGIDAGEEHRYTKAKGYWEPWRCEAPLIEHGILFKSVLMDMLADEGIDPPALYALGFPHNNCGGFCIKAGIGHFKMLLDKLPERYAYHEAKEQEMRDYLDKDVAILRDRSGGKVRPLTLRELRERVEAQQTMPDEDDIGGCNCVNPDAEVDAEIVALGMPTVPNRAAS